MDVSKWRTLTSLRSRTSRIVVISANRLKAAFCRVYGVCGGNGWVGVLSIAEQTDKPDANPRPFLFLALSFKRSNPSETTQRVHALKTTRFYAKSSYNSRICQQTNSRDCCPFQSTSNITKTINHQQNLVAVCTDA